MIAPSQTNEDHTPIKVNIWPQACTRQQIGFVESHERFATETIANALKFASMGRRVLVVQLLKGGIRQGHDRIVNLAQNLDWIRCDSLRHFSMPDLSDLELAKFQQLWQHVRSKTNSGEYGLVILEDLSLAIEIGLVGIEAATNFLTQLPIDVELILTGTSHHPAIRQLATD